MLTAVRVCMCVFTATVKPVLCLSVHLQVSLLALPSLLFKASAEVRRVTLQGPAQSTTSP